MKAIGCAHYGIVLNNQSKNKKNICRLHCLVCLWNWWWPSIWFRTWGHSEPKWGHRGLVTSPHPPRVTGRLIVLSSLPGIGSGQNHKVPGRKQHKWIVATVKSAEMRGETEIGFVQLHWRHHSNGQSYIWNGQSWNSTPHRKSEMLQIWK